MFKKLKNTKLIQKLGIGCLLLICIIISISLSLRKTTNIGSAAKDPDACQIGNLMISLDKDIWDTDRFQVVRYFESQGIFRSADSAVVRLKYELEDSTILSNPCIQFDYYRFDDYTYEQYIDSIENAIEPQIDIFDSYTKSTAQYEGYEAHVYKYSLKDGNSFYEIIIGKGTSAYGITYISDKNMYEEYLGAFQDSLNSIHIKRF